MARREADNLIARLRRMSEEGVASFVDEVMSNQGLRKRLGRAGERLLANKQAFDRNIESLLDFVSVPSKRDIRELKARLDHLSSALVNLSMKVDRMLASKEKGGAKPAPRRRPRPRPEGPPSET